MLGLLDGAFNLDPGNKIDDALALMNPGLRKAAENVMATVLEGGTRPGPSFEDLS